MNSTHRAKLCTHKAQTKIVVAVVRMIVVTLGRTQILRIVVPGAATYHAVRAKYGHYAKLKDCSNSLLLSLVEFA